MRGEPGIFTPSHKFVDMVINHPAVRPTVQRGTERLSSEAVLNRPGTLAVGGACGVALFQRYNDTWDAHIFVLPSGRGAAAVAFGKRALERLAIHTGGSGNIHTGVPIVLPQARFYCRRLGLKPEGRDLFNEYFTTEILSWAV